MLQVVLCSASSSTGLKFLVDDNKSLQAWAEVPTTVFNEFSVTNPDAQVIAFSSLHRSI